VDNSNGIVKRASLEIFISWPDHWILKTIDYFQGNYCPPTPLYKHDQAQSIITAADKASLTSWPIPGALDSRFPATLSRVTA
jgi:hypothetical protein